MAQEFPGRHRKIDAPLTSPPHLLLSPRSSHGLSLGMFLGKCWGYLWMFYSSRERVPCASPSGGGTAPPCPQLLGTSRAFTVTPGSWDADCRVEEEWQVTPASGADLLQACGPGPGRAKPANSSALGMTPPGNCHGGTKVRNGELGLVGIIDVCARAEPETYRGLSLGFSLPSADGRLIPSPGPLIGLLTEIHSEGPGGRRASRGEREQQRR